MADFSITIEDHSDEVLKALEENKEAILEAWGQQAVSHAKSNITAAGRVDTGALRNSISHQVELDEGAVYVGTNQDYAIYNEYGTGIYLEGGGGRQDPWSYQDSKGNWHRTRGMKAIHFLKNAITEHFNEYKSIAESLLKR